MKKKNRDKILDVRDAVETAIETSKKDRTSTWKRAIPVNRIKQYRQIWKSNVLFKAKPTRFIAS